MILKDCLEKKTVMVQGEKKRKMKAAEWPQREVRAQVYAAKGGQEG